MSLDMCLDGVPSFCKKTWTLAPALEAAQALKGESNGPRNSHSQYFVITTQYRSKARWNNIQRRLPSFSNANYSELNPWIQADKQRLEHCFLLCQSSLSSLSPLPEELLFSVSCLCMCHQPTSSYFNKQLHVSCCMNFKEA